MAKFLIKQQERLWKPISIILIGSDEPTFPKKIENPNLIYQ